MLILHLIFPYPRLGIPLYCYLLVLAENDSRINFVGALARVCDVKWLQASESVVVFRRSVQVQSLLC